MRNKLPPKSLDRYAAVRNVPSDRVVITADERTASAAADSRVSVSSPTYDPADAAGTVRALRAFGIVR